MKDEFSRYIHLIMDNLYFKVENVLEPHRRINHAKDFIKWLQLTDQKDSKKIIKQLRNELSNLVHS